MLPMQRMLEWLNVRTYNLRAGVTQNYRQLSSLTIPQINRTRLQDKLYPIEVVERNGS